MPSPLPHAADHHLRLRRLGIDTYQETVIYMRADCEVCRSEGFQAQARVQVKLDGRTIIATLNVLLDSLLAPGEASLSEAAWRLLGAREGDAISVSHPPPLESLSYVRGKVYGQRFSRHALQGIIEDVVAGRYADVQLAAFVTACAADQMDREEMTHLTRAMISVGERLSWGKSPIVDKHSVGGLPGNRTTPIVVAIVAAFGLTIPKTSSRAITSPAGTADTMETLAPVDLDVPAMRRVVEKENGCIVWGGAVRLSPADDVLIRVERILDLDSEGQLVASVLSKKAAAGSTHVVLDIPVGPTAKVRGAENARVLSAHLEAVGRAVGLTVRPLISDGKEPVGRGVGPGLEAWDVLAVLQNQKDAPADLRERSLDLAGHLIELPGKAAEGRGKSLAAEILESGKAWKKFVAICEAQGGMREPPRAPYTHPVTSPRRGRVAAIDNRLLARTAKLAGAPHDPAAGIFLHAKTGSPVEQGEPLFTIHAESPGELSYALAWADGKDIVQVVAQER